jgi:predicted ATPase
VLASRIDRLPSGEKELLQTLAVLGREFAMRLVHRVTGKSDDDLEQMLNQLELGEFIFEQPAASDDLEYVFKHALTQEVAYNSLLGERRRALHDGQRAGSKIFTGISSKAITAISLTIMYAPPTRRRPHTMRG